MEKDGKRPKKQRNHGRSEGNTQTSISMNTEIIELGKRLAQNDMRTFSNLVASLIAEEAKRRGFPKAVKFSQELPTTKVAEEEENEP